MTIRPDALRLYAVTDRSWLRPGETLEEVVAPLLAHGVTCLQLREKGADHWAITAAAKALLPLCRAQGVPLIVNDDVEAALEAGADGVHVGQSDMDIARARALLGPDKIIGASAHNLAEALAAQNAGADYLGCGAVFGSATKGDVTRLDLEELSRICRGVSIPVVAIGGITAENLPLLARRGIAGAAVVSALFAPADKGAAARTLRRLADQAAGDR